MIRIGIDPGLTGAIAVLKEERLEQVYDMPSFQDGKARMVNAAEVAKILKLYIPLNNWVTTVFLERVSARPGQGVSSCFNFGCGYGIIQGVVATIGFPIVLVTPQSWKKRANLIHSEKDQARTMAQRLYPQAELGRKSDIGRADALLIARFGA